MASEKVFLLAEGEISWNTLSQHRWWHSATALPKGQRKLETFFLDNATLTNTASVSTECSNTNQHSQHELIKLNGGLFLGRLSPPSCTTRAAAFQFKLCCPLPTSTEEVLAGARGHHTRVWSTPSNPHDHWDCIHRLSQPDYSFCNHFPEIQKRNLPTPLWASMLVNSIVPLWPFLGFSWYCLWFPLGQYL